MYSTNEVHLIGNLGTTPELRNAGDTPVTSFRLATTERWKDSEDKLQERTQWHTVVCWGRLAETVAKALKKGSYVSVSGSISYRSYTDKKDAEREIYVTEIRATRVGFLDRVEKSRGAEGEEAPSEAAAGDEDMPF